MDSETCRLCHEKLSENQYLFIPRNPSPIEKARDMFKVLLDAYANSRTYHLAPTSRSVSSEVAGFITLCAHF